MCTKTRNLPWNLPRIHDLLSIRAEIPTSRGHTSPIKGTRRVLALSELRHAIRDAKAGFACPVHGDS